MQSHIHPKLIPPARQVEIQIIATVQSDFKTVTTRINDNISHSSLSPFIDLAAFFIFIHPSLEFIFDIIIPWITPVTALN